MPSHGCLPKGVETVVVTAAWLRPQAVPVFRHGLDLDVLPFDGECSVECALPLDMLNI